VKGGQHVHPTKSVRSGRTSAGAASRSLSTCGAIATSGESHRPLGRRGDQFVWPLIAPVSEPALITSAAFPNPWIPE
jgi:hypothetical protein